MVCYGRCMIFSCKQVAYISTSSYLSPTAAADKTLTFLQMVEKILADLLLVAIQGKVGDEV